MLFNCLLSELDEGNYQRHSLVQLEVRQPIINFYIMLLRWLHQRGGYGLRGGGNAQNQTPMVQLSYQMMQRRTPSRNCIQPMVQSQTRSMYALPISGALPLHITNLLPHVSPPTPLTIGHQSNACQFAVLDEVNYQRHSIVQLEVRQYFECSNFYTMFLHAGVIRPIEDANINGVDMDFKV
ncbi:hypothetical protein QYM36_018928 [Artemia franciscana]|uniref:Uncharacterized protein n=1 Tax=Artemia franciscana TaxID=6661 RepID=A0AA88H5Z2_ARTSF|nr:hypothetical protein QYM36_018928 [Artemia franciscana]